MLEDSVYLGHTRVVLRSDNGPALLLLVGDALKGLRVQQLETAAAEGSVPHDPQTAGPAEVSVQNLKCQVRAMHLTLDRFLEKHVPVTHPLIAWLVEHAASVRLTGVVGRDGRTAYYKIRRTEHSLRLPFFVENEYDTKGDRVRVESPARASVGATASLWGFIAGRTCTSCSTRFTAFARPGL